MMAAGGLRLGPETPRSTILRIAGRYRLPSDLVSQLKHALAENPHVVILDLEDAASNSLPLFEVLEPVAPYLAEWPGTVVVVCVPDPDTAAPLLPPTVRDRVLLDRSPQAALERARQVIEHQHRTTTFLTPSARASEDARGFTRRTLRDWRLDDLIWPASLVVSELVTHSILKAETVLDLTLSRVDQRVRIAVHDFGSGDEFQVNPLARLDDPLEDPLLHRGLLVVRELTRCWGVFPSRDHGKTVWAVMETSEERVSAGRLAP